MKGGRLVQPAWCPPWPGQRNWKWGARPPRALPAGALAGWLGRAPSLLKVQSVRGALRVTGGAPVTAPGAGAVFPTRAEPGGYAMKTVNTEGAPSVQLYERQRSNLRPSTVYEVI